MIELKINTADLLIKRVWLLGKMTNNPNFASPILILGDFIIARNSLKRETKSDYDCDNIMIGIERQKKK